ncbi:MAG: ribose-phosphate pyrophosphokinase [Clostridia bacterium]|nr:ribose-phosphate pyrophosphokinase [Clostridia bacterium]
MNETLHGDLSVIGMKGTEDFTRQVDSYLRLWRSKGGASANADNNGFIIWPDSIRFGTGEAKCIIHESMRGHDVYIIADMYNYGVTYKMYGKEFPMSPDDHFQDLKRIIGAIGGKARRICVIMPMLYEARQDKRTARESLDCAMALQELVNMGVSNIITFDVHNIGVQNAIPLAGFDNVRPTYQMIKSLIANVPDIKIDSNHLMIISPDEGGMGRCMYYSSVLGLQLGMFYKRRDYSRVVDGKNPIIAHEYLGGDLHDMDVVIVDDIISSGESMLDVAAKLKSRGARRIFMFASFGLFCNGLEKIDAAYEEGIITKIFTTNLIYRSPELKARPWYCEVNICKYVALLIDTLNHDGSISGLLDPSDRIRNLVEDHKAALETEENN